MWRATVLAAGMAIALGGAFADDAAAQGKGKAVGKASERFEKRDERGGKATTGRVVGREVTQDDRRRSGDEPWYGRDRDDRDRDRDRDRVYYPGSDRDRDDRYRTGQKNGPAFCRSGAGHPVHGREWCRQKGYRLGNDQWNRAGWEDVIFGRRDRNYDSGRMNGSILEQVLGRVVFGRLDTQSRRLGGGSMWGQWVAPAGGPRILQVYSGSRPLAEIYDQNRDGRSDVILLNFGR